MLWTTRMKQKILIFRSIRIHENIISIFNLIFRGLITDSGSNLKWRLTEDTSVLFNPQLLRQTLLWKPWSFIPGIPVHNFSKLFRMWCVCFTTLLSSYLLQGILFWVFQNTCNGDFLLRLIRKAANPGSAERASKIIKSLLKNKQANKNPF